MLAVDLQGQCLDSLLKFRQSPLANRGSTSSGYVDLGDRRPNSTLQFLLPPLDGALVSSEDATNADLLLRQIVEYTLRSGRHEAPSEDQGAEQEEHQRDNGECRREQSHVAANGFH